MNDRIRTVHAGRVLTLNLETVTLPNGRVAELEIAHHPGGAAVVAVDSQGRTCLLRQYRHAAGGWIREIPAGKLDGGEAPLRCGQRELLEETGLAAAEWREILRVQLSNSVTDELAIGYLATGLSQVEEAPEGDGTEDIARVRVPFREALDAAMAGWISDVLTVAMLLKAYHMAMEGGLPRNLAKAMLG